MQGDPEIIELLNEILTAELTAINQYYIHAKMCENWGYQKLAKKTYDESIDEMRDAERIIDRILYLEGVPNLQRLGKINVGQTVPEQLRLDLEVEKASVTALNAAIELCRSLADNGSREMLEHILRDEEEHANWLEAQLTLIAQAGEANYLAQQIREDE